MRRSDVLDALAADGGELGQVLALLAAAGEAEPERLPVAAGDRLLLELHREVAGRELELTLLCPRCGTVNAVVLAPETVPPRRERTAWLGGRGGLRGPTYDDLRDLPADADEARRELLRRCVVGTPASEPADDALDLVDDSLAGPLVVACAGCDETVEVPLDAERAVLESLRGVADELEREIHLLARAYHWGHAAIVALPDERRSRLAELVESGL